MSIIKYIEITGTFWMNSLVLENQISVWMFLVQRSYIDFYRITSNMDAVVCT